MRMLIVKIDEFIIQILINEFCDCTLLVSHVHLAE